MAQYLVYLIGHIIEAFRPEGFPRSVRHDFLVEADSHEQLNHGINEETGRLFYKQKSFIVPKDPTKMINLQKPDMDTRLIVPAHMISYIETKTQRLVDPSQPKEDPLDLSGFEGTKGGLKQ